jgi:hypothetical protein
VFFVLVSLLNSCHHYLSESKQEVSGVHSAFLSSPTATMVIVIIFNTVSYLACFQINQCDDVDDDDDDDSMAVFHRRASFCFLSLSFLLLVRDLVARIRTQPVHELIIYMCFKIRENGIE